MQFNQDDHNPNPNTSTVSLMAPLMSIMQNRKNVSDTIVPFEADLSEQQVPNFDISDILNELEKPQERQKSNTTSIMTTRQQMLNIVPKLMFLHCTIQNVTFNLPKKRRT